jgi:excisionase family DNA binding protein
MNCTVCGCSDVAWVSVRQVPDAFSAGVGLVRGLIRGRELPAQKLGGRYRISHQEVHLFLRRATNRPETAVQDYPDWKAPEERRSA